MGKLIFFIISCAWKQLKFSPNKTSPATEFLWQRHSYGHGSSSDRRTLGRIELFRLFTARGKIPEVAGVGVVCPGSEHWFGVKESHLTSVCVVSRTEAKGIRAGEPRQGPVASCHPAPSSRSGRDASRLSNPCCAGRRSLVGWQQTLKWSLSQPPACRRSQSGLPGVRSAEPCQP